MAICIFPIYVNLELVRAWKPFGNYVEIVTISLKHKWPIAKKIIGRFSLYQDVPFTMTLQYTEN